MLTLDGGQRWRPLYLRSLLATARPVDVQRIPTAQVAL
jgi:hypothetical protein